MSSGILRSGERDITVLSALVTFPLRGIRTARIEVDADEDDPLLPGPATLILAADNEGEPVELAGTILEVDASTFEGRATAFFVGGKGTLATTKLPPRSYQQAPFDVDVASIATDAVEEAGEEFDDDTALTLLSVPRWHRVETTAAELLDRLAARFGFSWRLNDEGRVVFAVDKWLDADEDAAGLLLEGPENAQDRTIAGSVARASIRPGTVVRGRRIEEAHYLLDGKSLRVLLRWGEGNGAGGLRGDVETMTRRALPNLAYYGVHDATVRRQRPDGTLDLDADDGAIGGIPAVPYYPGVIGCRLNVAEGTRAILAFRNGDETKPVVVGFERLEINLATIYRQKAVARVDDSTGNGTLTFVAIGGAIPGTIGEITVTYTPNTGPAIVFPLLPGPPAEPGTPVVIPLSGQIVTGSPEVLLRADP